MNNNQPTPIIFKEGFVVRNNSNISSIEAAPQVNDNADNLPLDLSLKGMDREKKVDTSINMIAAARQAVPSRTMSDMFRVQSGPSGFLGAIKTEKSKFFQCKFNGCGKIFGYKHVLQNHENIHTGVRPYYCVVEHCGKSFRRKHHLKTHERIHTGEKPYCCEACHKNFRQLANLNCHKFSCAHRKADVLLEEKVSTLVI